MNQFIRCIVIVPLSFILTTGCSGQKNENPQNVSKSHDIKCDSTDNTIGTENLSEKPLVTFIELGSVKCIPCKMMQPIIEEIEKEYIGQVDVIFHDVWTEEGQPYAKQYKIKAIPTQIFLDKDDKEYFRHTGFFPKDEIIKVLKQKGVK